MVTCQRWRPSFCAACGTNRPGQAIYNLCCALLTCRANLSSSPANDILNMSSVMLELRVEKVFFSTPPLSPGFACSFWHLYKIKNKCQPSGGKAAGVLFSFLSFFFFFPGRCGRLQMRCRVEEAAACLGKLLMHARFNSAFPHSRHYRQRRRRTTNWDWFEKCWFGSPLKKGKWKEGKSQ